MISSIQTVEKQEQTKLLAVVKTLAPMIAELRSSVGVEVKTQLGEDSDEFREVTARLLLSTVIEPGDGAAGLALRRFGAQLVAELILNKKYATTFFATQTYIGAAEESNGELQVFRRFITAASARLDLTGLISSVVEARRLGMLLLMPGDLIWPSSLEYLGVFQPFLLWLRGQLSALPGARSVSLVGSRAASGYGEHVTSEISSGLANHRVTVVSGGAYGIDGTAHRAALASSGCTVAVLAGGLDSPYPAGHWQLFERIIESGALLSEMPCGSKPSRWRFLKRNRLIAAISSATVVLEAGQRSGSLNTAGHAAQLGRPLGAVPGPVTSPNSTGCHRLIREYGAICVTNVAEVLEIMAAQEPAQIPLSGLASEIRELFDFDEPAKALWQSLSSRKPQTVNQLSSLVNQAADNIMTLLGIWESLNLVIRRADGWLAVPRT